MKYTTQIPTLALAFAIFSIAHTKAEEVAPVEKPLKQKVLAAHDKDGDGKLSEEEREAARGVMKEKFEARRKEAIAKFDKDGDGKLNEEEKQAAKDARKKEMLEKFDKDGDGKLSEEEKKAAGAAIGKPPHRPGKRPGKRPAPPAAE